MILSIKDLCVNFEELEVLKGVTIDIPEGEISLLLGANGSGKSTLLRTISGLKPQSDWRAVSDGATNHNLPPVSGSISFEGKRIDGMKPHQIFKLGIIQMSEGFSIIAPMTVMDNLKLGGDRRKDKRQASKDRAALLERFPILKQKQKMVSGKMSGGEQQILCVARALMAKPKLLLLDEPSKGLSPAAVGDVADTVKQINQSGVTIILVEHNLRLGLKLAHNVFVLENGVIAFQTKASDLTQVDYAKKIYLGG